MLRRIIAGRATTVMALAVAAVLATPLTLLAREATPAV